MRITLTFLIVGYGNPSSLQLGNRPLFEAGGQE